MPVFISHHSFLHEKTRWERNPWRRVMISGHSIRAIKSVREEQNREKERGGGAHFVLSFLIIRKVDDGDDDDDDGNELFQEVFSLRQWTWSRVRRQKGFIYSSEHSKRLDKSVGICPGRKRKNVLPPLRPLRRVIVRKEDGTTQLAQMDRPGIHAVVKPAGG